MSNPFEKRATEYLRDDEPFLSVVTPEPLLAHFKKPAQEDRLYDRLAMVIGTPGSGKTTLARLFEYKTLCTLLRNEGIDRLRPILDAMGLCHAIAERQPLIVGCRVPFEGDYRDFWEFPYPDDLKINLMLALLQARAVLAWLRNMQDAGHKLDTITIVPRPDSVAGLKAIGGTEAAAVLQQAREVELTIYRVAAALVPPSIAELDVTIADAYRPLDVIEAFEIAGPDRPLRLKPLVIFDDVHDLHKKQFGAVYRWLTRREIRVARWMLMRFDALSSRDVLFQDETTFLNEHEEGAPGIKREREITVIWLQGTGDRGEQRRSFRKMARDMANRYLSLMDIFNRRGFSTFEDLLIAEAEEIAPSHLETLRKSVAATQKRLGIVQTRRKMIEEEVTRYLDQADPTDRGQDVHLAMVNILLERYAKRVPQGSLFEGNEGPEPSRPLTANGGIADGARVQLLHKFNRPYYWGMDKLCDAASQNAELFLHLAGRLASHAETQLIRGKSASIRGRTQHTQLTQKAKEMMSTWDFPEHELVRKLMLGIAAECVQKTLEPNASLDNGATAFGIPQEEFDRDIVANSTLAKVLHYGSAYNAFSIVPNYGTKRRSWCLVELGGVALISSGLSLVRGGFLERRLADLNEILEGPSP